MQVDDNGDFGFSNEPDGIARIDGDRLILGDAEALRLEEQPGNPLVGSWVAGPDDGSPGRASSLSLTPLTT